MVYLRLLVVILSFIAMNIKTKNVPISEGLQPAGTDSTGGAGVDPSITVPALKNVSTQTEISALTPATTPATTPAPTSAPTTTPTAITAPATFRCGGVTNDCCSTENPCSLNDGFCDEDSDCVDSLICGHKNCAWDDNGNCCRIYSQPRDAPVKFCEGGDGCCTAQSPCRKGDGDCDYDTQCLGSLKCGKNNCNWGENTDCCEIRYIRCAGKRACCTRESPCRLNDGPCKRTAHCMGNLICGKNNCAFRGPHRCCEIDPSIDKDVMCNGYIANCCQEMTPCKMGDGDCNSDKDCEGDLVCGVDNCSWGQYDDCCHRDQGTNKKVPEGVPYAPESEPEEAKAASAGVAIHALKPDFVKIAVVIFCAIFILFVI